MVFTVNNNLSWKNCWVEIMTSDSTMKCSAAENTQITRSGLWPEVLRPRDGQKDALKCRLKTLRPRLCSSRPPRKLRSTPLADKISTNSRHGTVQTAAECALTRTADTTHTGNKKPVGEKRVSCIRKGGRLSCCFGGLCPTVSRSYQSLSYCPWVRPTKRKIIHSKYILTFRVSFMHLFVSHYKIMFLCRQNLICAIQKWVNLKMAVLTRSGNSLSPLSPFCRLVVFHSVMGQMCLGRVFPSFSLLPSSPNCSAAAAPFCMVGAHGMKMTIS